MCKSVPSYDELIKQQRFSFPMTRAVFINRNLYENCFLEVSISVVLRQKQGFCTIEDKVQYISFRL